MRYIVDIILALILVFATARGYKRGLVKTLFGCLTVVAALVLAYAFGSYAGALIRQTPVFDTISQTTNERICEYFDKTLKDGIDKAQKDKDASSFVKSLEKLGVDTESLLEGYSSALEKGAEGAKDSFVRSVSTPVLKGLTNAVGALAVFVLSLLVLKVLCCALDVVARLPLLRTVNKFGGIAAGMLSGVLTCLVICLAIETFVPYLPQNSLLYVGMEKETVLYGFFVNLFPMIFLIFG